MQVKNVDEIDLVRTYCSCTKSIVALNDIFFSHIIECYKLSIKMLLYKIKTTKAIHLHLRYLIKNNLFHNI